MPAAPQDVDARAKKTNRGCWIALLSAFALMTIAAVVVAIVVNRIIAESPIPEWGRKVGEGADILLDAQSAKGVGELRDLGCESAMILDVERLLDFLETLEDAGKVQRPPDSPTHAIMCWTRTTVACDDAAQSFVAHGRVKGDFAVVVSEGNRQQSQVTCARRYDETGKRTGSFDPKTVPIP